MAGSSPSGKLTGGAGANAAPLRRTGKTSAQDRTRLVLLVFALYILTVFVPRVLIFPVSDIDWDEYYSALVAQGLLQGKLPFDYVFGGHHPATTCYFYAPFLAVFGSGIIAIRSIALTYASAAFYLIYRICTSAGLEPKLSSVCAALYGVSTLPWWGLASNTELILNALVLSVALACLSYSRGPTRTGVVMIGAISGVCVSVNYLVAPIVATLGLSAIILVRRNAKAVLIDLGVAAAAVLSMFGILLLPVALFGHIVAYFSDQIAWSNMYASQAIERPTDSEFNFLIKYWIAAILVPTIPAAVILCVKRAEFPLSERGRMILIFLCCYVVAAVLAAAAPGRFYPHYALLVTPAIALLTGAVLYSRRGGDTLRYALVLTAAIAVAQPAFNNMTRWNFERGADGWMRWLNHEPSDSLAEIAREVKLHTHSGDYIFVTFTHALYILSDTRSPTRFAFGGDSWVADPAVMRIFGTTPADELDRVLALHPKVIVVRGHAPAARGQADPKYLRKFAAALGSQYEYLETIAHAQLYRLKPFSASHMEPLAP